jgi:hypothetical protein
MQLLQIYLHPIQVLLRFTLVSQHRVHPHGLHLPHAKVLLHIGLLVVAVAAAVHMMAELLAEEVGVLLQRERMV